MHGRRMWGVTVVGLLLAFHGFVVPAARAADGLSTAETAPLFRVFLKDGGSLVSFGEFARVDNRIVFSMPTSASFDNPDLQLVDLAADRIDWERTDRYAESIRATRYLQARAESDYALLTGEIAQALNDIGLADNPRDRLAIVQRARKALADWPPSHHNYKRDDVRSMLGMLDEVIADLRAAAGAERFDVSLFTAVAAAPALDPLLPSPSLQDLVEQILVAARLTDAAAERTSLLSVVLSVIDQHRADLPVEWARTTRASAATLLDRELALDRAYRSLGGEMLSLATARARLADVRGVERVIGLVSRRDAALGSVRPDALNGILAAVQDQLDAARRLRLARDAWAIRLPELRAYRDAIGSSLSRLAGMGPALEDIKALSGSGPDAIGAILRGVAAIQKVTAVTMPPAEFVEMHALVVSAVQMADSAARIRREAALTGDMVRAWNASSAAAGALMLSARAMNELQAALRIPQLPR